MSRSDWRKLAKAGGLGLLGLAGAAGLASAWLYSYHEFYQPAEQDQTVQRYQPARDATQPPAPANNQPRAPRYDPHCEQPQSYEDADLCAQWGAVQAVTETNRLTRVALRLGYIGFWVALMGGLFGTLGTILIWLAWQETKTANRIARRDYGRARLEAKAAARAAEEALTHTRETDRMQLEARLVAHAGFDAHQVNVHLANRGRTFAYDVNCAFTFKLTLAGKVFSKGPIILQKAAMAPEDGKGVTEKTDFEQQIAAAIIPDPEWTSAIEKGETPPGVTAKGTLQIIATALHRTEFGDNYRTITTWYGPVEIIYYIERSTQKFTLGDTQFDGKEEVIRDRLPKP